MESTKVFLAMTALILLCNWGCAEAPQSMDPTPLQQAEAPPDGVWVDDLDLSQAPIRRPRRPRGASGAQAPAEPPPPIRVAWGGVEYPHGVPIASNRVNDDITIDLKGQAVRFMSMVGIDDGRGEGEGSAVFGLWGGLPVRDLWRQTDLGTFTGRFSTTVPRHGAMFVKIG